MGDDDLFEEDDPLEAAFRDLEAELALDQLKRKRPGSPPPTRTASSGEPPDPLADLKAIVGGNDKPDVMLVRCTSCHANNRVPLKKLRRAQALCGRCGHVLAVERG